MLSEVVIDKRILEAFKRRCLKRYPNERLEVLLGKIVGDQAHVHSLQDIAHKSRRLECESDEDIEYSEHIGTIHSHPDIDCTPSNTDIETAIDEGEKIFGICSIRRKNNRRFISWGFFAPNGHKLHLVISE